MPSPALVVYAVWRGLPVRALIRPRPGGFAYDEPELALMGADIATMLYAGAQGVVLAWPTVLGALPHPALV